MRQGFVLLACLLLGFSGCVHSGPGGSRTSAPEGSASLAQRAGQAGGAAHGRPGKRSGSALGDGPSVEKQRFLTLEEEPLLAESMRGLKAVWIFWPGTGDDPLHHMEVRAFRQRLDRLLASRGDLVVLEFHHHHLSAQRAPRRDRSRHEHLWDPQAIVAMRLNVPKLPAALIVAPDLSIFDAFAAPETNLPDFYLKIIQSLANLDASDLPKRS